MTIDDDADTTSDTMTALSLAAAAVVSGPMLEVALALGTPVVCTAAGVERLGLRAGREVALAEDGSRSARMALGRAIAADDERAAHLSTAARRFAESTLDVGRIADVVLDRLGLAPTPMRRREPLGRLDDRLAELATPRTAAIRSRAASAASCFGDPDDWS